MFYAISTTQFGLIESHNRYMCLRVSVRGWSRFHGGMLDLLLVGTSLWAPMRDVLTIFGGL
ncbi:hypothetical protein A7X93_07740 [Stenotrophomonas maltophilia]|uniref:Uncharacterized protein n=1 Tax=Stenotrophomonas maltophilia TaxID=40324 RepID=A0AAP7GQ75_STEMA|nr:hypothetical protein A9K56_15855 [Stenotrophomonas maltophilia]PZT33767.1 hypothetical protein A7X93_07740 [Stenotrophomonas maltophilia]